MAYTGLERRIHKVFVTRNTEYHVRQDTCVGVRDRRSGEWLRAHLALRSRVAGALKFTGEGSVKPNAGSPEIGESLCFHAAGRDLITSTVIRVERPGRDIVAAYGR
jgi:hypothetical protein